MCTAHSKTLLSALQGGPGQRLRLGLGGADKAGNSNNRETGE